MCNAMPPVLPMRAPLLAEDGATLHAHLEPVSGTEIQASCWAQLDHRSSIEVEAPDYLLCHDKAEARAWVQRTAAARGFKSISWDDKFSATP